MELESKKVVENKSNEVPPTTAELQSRCDYLEAQLKSYAAGGAVSEAQKVAKELVEKDPSKAKFVSLLGFEMEE